jgi:hypothetical protein
MAGFYFIIMPAKAGIQSIVPADIAAGFRPTPE